MGFILKQNSPLINTKLTDAGRRKISQGNFNISYFQIGDSEIDYNNIDDVRNSMVIKPEYNYHNTHMLNTSSIKYPIYINDSNPTGFGIPFQNSTVDVINNKIEPYGFFDSALKTGENYVKNPNFTCQLNTIDGGDTINLDNSLINGDANDEIEVGDILIIYFDDIVDNINANIPILTYMVMNVNNNEITLDRDLPDFSIYNGAARIVVYPKNMKIKYDTEDPMVLWNESTLKFEGLCDINDNYTKIWNMNIVWKDLPAGVMSSVSDVGSKEFLGTLEYFGYNTSDGQTDYGEISHKNSFGENIVTDPKDKKAIAIIHYTNNTVDEFYGEKFSMDEGSGPGSMSNFKIHIPWIMWHKSDSNTIGQTFYVRPPNTNHYEEKRVVSKFDETSNGMRYFSLWDDSQTPNRVGRVWPDLKMITIDDDELVMVLNGKSNRNFTLPSPKISLIDPNTFSDGLNTNLGILNNNDEVIWVTYRFENKYHNYIHCNYYNYLEGQENNSNDILFKFGDEFKFMTDQTDITGYWADKIFILLQKTHIGQKPQSNSWREIEVTDKYNGDLTEQNLISTTIEITKDDFDNSTLYYLNNNIRIGGDFNFGKEFFFYGTIQTDIQATIYVMNYLCNLPDTQFNISNNPTWSEDKDVYVSEIGLYDNEKELMIISKLSTPQKRIGVQQYSIKLDI